MAIIGKIRSKSGLVIGFVAVALVLFVLSDFLTNKNGGQDPNDMVAGEVFGEDIKLLDYNQQSQAAIDQARQNAPDQYTEDMGDRLREEVWNQMVNRMIFDKELSSFNFVITPAELNDLIYGDNIQEYIKNTAMFKNRFTGEFSVDSVKAWRKRIDQSPDGKRWWVQNIETPVKDNRGINKYFNLITKGMYVTTAEANRDNIDQNRKYKIKYVVQQFSNIPDSTIKVTDEDIKKYYEANKHRKKYEQQVGSRTISYVEFLLVPSQADIDATKLQAEDIAARFKDETNDSSFVMTYAETKVYNDAFMAPGMYPAEIDSVIQKADSGSVIGPYRDGDFWKIMKVRGMKMEPEASVRHILVGFNTPGGKTRTKEEASKRADSILNVLKRDKSKFDELVKLSDDGGSVNNGGVYEYFPKGRMVKPFEDASFNGKMNVIQKVETDYGFHLVEPLQRRDAKRVKTAMVDIKIIPMKESNMAVRAQAVDFLANLKDATKFQETAQKLKLNVQTREIADNQRSVDGTNGGRVVASFAHEGNINDVSEPLLFKGSDRPRQPNEQYDRYVVAKLDKIKKKGIPEFEDVKEMMKFQVIREIKGKQEAEKMKGAKSLEELATKMNTVVREAELSFSTSTIPGLQQGGTEYAVIGSIFSMKKPGDMSVPLKGSNGVYVVVLTSVTEAPALANPEQSKTQLTGIVRGRAQSDAYSALRTLAKIEDKRPMN